MDLLDSALVLFSGGQDSTVCLAWALERFARVETIGFAYGQRHAIELKVRPHIRSALAARSQEWRTRLGDDHVVRLDALAEISDTALTREAEIGIVPEDPLFCRPDGKIRPERDATFRNREWLHLVAEVTDRKRVSH